MLITFSEGGSFVLIAILEDCLEDEEKSMVHSLMGEMQASKCTR